MRDARINGALCLIVLTDEWKKRTQINIKTSLFNGSNETEKNTHTIKYINRKI